MRPGTVPTPSGNALSGLAGDPVLVSQAQQNQSAPVAPPTNAGLQTRRASPAKYMTSGIEKAMGAMANKLHPVKGL